MLSLSLFFISLTARHVIIVIIQLLGHFHAALKKPGFHGHGFAVLEGDRGTVTVKSPCGGLVVTRRA